MGFQVLISPATLKNKPLSLSLSLPSSRPGTSRSVGPYIPSTTGREQTLDRLLINDPEICLTKRFFENDLLQSCSLVHVPNPSRSTWMLLIDDQYSSSTAPLTIQYYCTYTIPLVQLFLPRWWLRQLHGHSRTCRLVQCHRTTTFGCSVISTAGFGSDVVMSIVGS